MMTEKLTDEQVRKMAHTVDAGEVVDYYDLSDALWELLGLRQCAQTSQMKLYVWSGYASLDHIFIVAVAESKEEAIKLGLRAALHDNANLRVDSYRIKNLAAWMSITQDLHVHDIKEKIAYAHQS